MNRHARQPWIARVYALALAFCFTIGCGGSPASESLDNRGNPAGGSSVSGSGGLSAAGSPNGGSTALAGSGQTSSSGGAAARAGAGGATSGGGQAGLGNGGAGGSAGASAGTGNAGSAGTSGATGGTGASAGGANYPISDGKPSVYLAADSTVQTYSASQAPQQGWGQRIAEFFTSDVSFVNKAIGGRSSKSFIDEGRLDEIEKLLKKGDYLFCQWGINDRYMSDPARYTNPATTFRDYLKQYIAAARRKNAIPVLVTPTPRLNYSNGMFMNDFVGYCDAIKAVGAETQTPVIDLQTKALAYYTSIGYEVVERDIALDVLHFKEKGAFEMARLVAEGTRALMLPISPFVK